ncbi:MAG: hypothetical protein ACPGOY_11520 [Rhodospirillaceae bacterium]
MSDALTVIKQYKGESYSHKYLPFVKYRRIKKAYLRNYISGDFIMSALRQTFAGTESKDTASPTEEGMTRRGMLEWLGRGAAGATAAAALTSLPFNQDAQAGEPRTAAITDEEALAITARRREMRHYSQDPEKRGVGVFINLRKGSSVKGKDIGEWIRNQFAGVNVPVDYRINQSQGTATNITFYVRDSDYTYNVSSLQDRIHDVYSKYKAAWLPETASLVPERG